MFLKMERMDHTQFMKEITFKEIWTINGVRYKMYVNGIEVKV